MIRWLTRKTVAPMHVMPGDTIQVTYRDAKGRKETTAHAITETGTYDTLAIAEVENELGFEKGLVGVVGKALE